MGKLLRTNADYVSPAVMAAAHDFGPIGEWIGRADARDYAKEALTSFTWGCSSDSKNKR